MISPIISVIYSRLVRLLSAFLVIACNPYHSYSALHQNYILSFPFHTVYSPPLFPLHPLSLPSHLHLHIVFQPIAPLIIFICGKMDQYRLNSSNRLNQSAIVVDSQKLTFWQRLYKQLVRAFSIISSRGRQILWIGSTGNTPVTQV